jgi:hypothetical protein
MTHYVAIITSKDYYSGYDGDGYQPIITSISDWAEVSDDEYKALCAAQSRMGYQILERPTDMKTFVARTVADYLAFAKAEEKRFAAEKRAREAAALDKKMKKELKTHSSKKIMLQKLATELGVEILEKTITKL